MKESTSIKLQKYQYSSSKRKVLAQCPLQYYHRNVAKTYPFVNTPAIQIGNLCDEVLESAIFTGEEPDLDALSQRIERIDPAYKFRDTLVEGVDAAHEYAVTRAGLRIQQQALAVNEKLQPTRVNWKKGSDLFDSCKPDLMTWQDTTLFIDDWKSGNPNYPDWTQTEDYGLYGYIFIPGIERVKTSIVWLREGRHPTEIVHKSTREFVRDQIPTVVKRWSAAHEEVVTTNQEGVWLPTPHAMCSYCEHFDNCEVHDDGYR